MENAITILGVTGNKVTFRSQIGRVLTKQLKGLNKNPYFIKGFDNKKVFINIETLEVLSLENSDNDLERFSFEVEYEHKGRPNGFALTTKTVTAKTYDEALEKINKSFKNIFEISEL
tara:strand:- start:75 stop:425 length:351 start_codon:yes stop_codon:yes gene_type:complete